MAAQIKSVSRARSYEIRHAAAGTGGTPGAWTTELVTSVKTPFAVNGLTPGTIYAFQVRALGKLGYTELERLGHQYVHVNE